MFYLLSGNIGANVRRTVYSQSSWLVSDAVAAAQLYAACALKWHPRAPLQTQQFVDSLWKLHLACSLGGADSSVVQGLYTSDLQMLGATSGLGLVEFTAMIMVLMSKHLPPCRLGNGYASCRFERILHVLH
jgi:hypothetical protein